MNGFAIIVLCFCFASFGYGAGRKGSAKISSRIYGGRAIDITEAPFMAALYYYDEFICGGSIVDPYYILTAAHCVNGRDEADLSVRVGSSRHADGTPHKVYEVMVHDDYNGATVENDIAVLFLEDPITISSSTQNKLEILSGRNKVIPLGNRSPRREDSVSVMGWGSTEFKKGASDVLKATTVTVIGKSKCKKLHKSVGIVGENAWCGVGSAGNQDTCDGDSGGPAVANGKIVGITSWGKGCGKKDQPGVYTDVSKLRNWIQHTLTTYK